MEGRIVSVFHGLAASRGEDSGNENGGAEKRQTFEVPTAALQRVVIRR